MRAQIQKLRRDGFTVVEALVSTSIVILMILLMVTITDQTGGLWKRTRGKVEQFREARAGFETLTQRLGQATLNTYWDYNNPDLPTRYQRRSELRFTSGQAASLLGPNGTNVRLGHCAFFHAPLGFTAARSTTGVDGYRGLENLLNGWGYFLEYGSDEPYRPQFINNVGIPPRWRFRLMEFSLPTESLATYNLTSGVTNKTPKAYGYQAATWFTDPLRRANQGNSSAPGTAHVLAENIVALILTPRLPKREEAAISGGTGDKSPLAPDYSYDSSPVAKALDDRYRDARLNPVNQLPPVVQVTMVAIDEDSSIRMGFKAGDEDVFKTRGKFKQTADYTKDLRIATTGDDNSLERELINRRVSYRIFTSNVAIRAAKWSRSQAEQ